MKITVVRSNRKTIGIQIKEDGRVLVRAPIRASEAEIKRIVLEKEEWIRKHVEKMQERSETVSRVQKLSEKEIEQLVLSARELIPQRVAYYAAKIGVSYGRITIRCQKTRWGSCSSEGNLNFNCLLMLTRPEVIDSIVVHELCHRKEMNHSKNFYKEIYRVYPDYNRWDRWLKNHGREIMARVF